MPEPKAPPGPTWLSHRRRPALRTRLAQRSRVVSILYLLMLPTIVSMLVFSYYPKLDVIRYAFYRWIPKQLVEWRGLGNFRDAINDKYFIASFQLVLVLLAANLVKMWPSIFTAIVLHRLKSDRLRYVFQIAFVIPMVIPALVWVLIWKSFYDPNVGILNRFLSITGLMDVLRALDRWMPSLAEYLAPVFPHVVQPVFGSIWGMGLLAAIGLLLLGGVRTAPRRWLLWLPMLIAALLLYGPLRGAVTLALAVAGVSLVYRAMPIRADGLVKRVSGGLFAVFAALVLLGRTWTSTTHAFDLGSPAWLADSNLIVPAVIFWGFPWVGTVGVLIYLAGLQQISSDVYEAAELDGVGPIGKLFRIELPLIMTQVRINLIFLTMATLTQYGLFLLLLGPSGGPEGKGLVPGLYMYRQAFIENKYGYSCALGMVMFLLILLLTIIYQRYVKVEK